MADLTALLHSLQKKQEELQKLQSDIRLATEQKFAALPEQVGLKTIDELIKALVA